MAIVFYYAPMSSATRVHWALDELALPYDKVKLDLRAGDQHKPAFLKLNPNGKVPVLVDNTHPIFESLAILVHLGDKYGSGRQLWPELKQPARLHALSWTVWSSTTLGPHLHRYLINVTGALPPEERSASQAEHAKKEFHHDLQLLEERLQERPFLIADHFTLVDLSVAGLLHYALQKSVDISAFPRLSEWTATCLRRPCLKPALEG